MAEKVTKNILTKEAIEKELKFLNKADMHSSTVLLSIMTVIFVPLSILPINTFFSANKKTIFLGIFCFAIFLLLLLPVFIFLIPFISTIKEARLLKKGDWFVDTDEIRYKAEELEHRRTIDVLYFYRYERVVTGRTIFQLTSQDDVFYLVMYKKKKPRVVLHYPQKMYEYKE